jgi:type IV secretion system protein VirB3
MFMGAPYVPLVIGAGTCLLLAMYVNLGFLLSIPVATYVMRAMAKRD